MLGVALSVGLGCVISIVLGGIFSSLEIIGMGAILSWGILVYMAYKRVSEEKTKIDKINNKEHGSKEKRR